MGFEVEESLSKAVEELEKENEVLIQLLHKILDYCYTERRDCGGIIEDMMIEDGVIPDETYNWEYRDGHFK